MSKDDKDNCKVYHHVVYSVKGGCGKTTFSLYLLMSDMLRKKQKERKDDGYEKADGRTEINYMFDMDFLGTSLLNVLAPPNNGKKNSASVVDAAPVADAVQIADSEGSDADSDNNNSVEIPDYIVMSDLIFNAADVRDLEKRSNHVIVKEKKTGGGFTGKKSSGVGKGKNATRVKYIIPSSSHEKDKEQFHVKRRNTPLLRYGEFYYEIAGIVSKIKLVESSKNMADGPNAPFDINFIYDMPPNADGYTEALFEYLLECAAKGENVFLYLVYNNKATLTCNMEWMASFLSSGRVTDKLKAYFVNNEIAKFTGPEADKIKVVEESTISDMADQYGIKESCCLSPIFMKFMPSVAMFNYGVQSSKDGVKLEDLFTDEAGEGKDGE